MKKPEFIKWTGHANEQIRVYIEDYVYSYLSGLRSEIDLLPLRAVLFGRVVKKDNVCSYMIYGACCVVEELECGRNEEQVRKDFFEEYELIGYVNICKSGQTFPGKDKGYFIFYESNEGMQNYLSFCYERKKKKESREKGLMVPGVPSGIWAGKGLGHAKDALKQIFMFVCVLILAMAVCAVNSYDEMSGFVEMTAEAAYMLETEG